MAGQRVMLEQSVWGHPLAIQRGFAKTASRGERRVQQPLNTHVLKC